MTFENKRWPLHFALAWVLTRDRPYCEQVTTAEFVPHLSRDEYKSAHEVDVAWELLHAAMVSGDVPAFSNSDTGEERVVASSITNMDWSVSGGRAAGLRRHGKTSGIREVTVSSNAMISRFPPGSKPVAFNSGHFGPPINPESVGFMSLSQAIYWIASEGGSKTIPIRPSVFEIPARVLITAIERGEVRLVGRRNVESLPEDIPSSTIAGLDVIMPGAEKDMPHVLAERPHIDLCLSGSAYWNEYNDQIWADRMPRPTLTHLEVDAASVAKNWPFKPTASCVPSRGKFAPLHDFFAHQFPDGVPPPSKRPRKTWVSELTQAIPALNGSLDQGTLKKAIDAYNEMVRQRQSALGQK